MTEYELLLLSYGFMFGVIISCILILGIEYISIIKK
jgi:hypothetical protein